MNNKAKGSRNERRTIALLEAAGYSCMKAGGSLGVFDVIGMGANDFIAVQVKTNRSASPAEIETIKDFRVPTNCKKLIHIWQDRKRMPIIKEL